MEINLNKILAQSAQPNTSFWEPLLFDVSKTSERDKFQDILRQHNGHLVIHDEIKSQVKELFKVRNPRQKPSEEDLEEHYKEWARQNDPQTYGMWVYYPWNHKMVHIVTQEEFIELRTSRNKYKITTEEQEKLSSKKVGVIGLSVGQSVAVTMAIERVFGTIRLADFDELELTNLNRIRCGISSLGLPKTIMAAREIAEIDPFLNVEIFEEGVNNSNIDQFMGVGEGKLDALIEECDSLDIKVFARFKAREKGIPVIMDTSDRGLIDIERFDLEPERKIFHGRADITDPQSLKAFSYDEKVSFILNIMGGENMSLRLKESMYEVGKSIGGWPQLASDVAAGGAICAALTREIFLDHPLKSGRFYMDPLEIVNQ